MRLIRKSLTLVICFLLPAGLVFWLLNLLGHRVDRRAKIGFSFIWMDGFLNLKKSARIGHLNFIRTNSITIDEGGYIGRSNNLNGPFEIILAKTAAIGNGNNCYRSPKGVTYGPAVLKLGILSKITSNHRIDCTRSITIGNYSTLAGHDSQLWTHSYYHDRTGPGRFRLDGVVEIGDNVNIGSKCVINCGVRITDGVTIGTNSSVSKSLLTPGVYVNQPMRFLELAGDQRSRFKKVTEYEICEEVYEKTAQ